MPKYSTVQAYSDNSSNIQTVPYEQASGNTAKGPGTSLTAVMRRTLHLFVVPRSDNTHAFISLSFFSM